MRNENVREAKRKVDESLVQKGLMHRVEAFLASKEAQDAIKEQFDLNLKAMRELSNPLPDCYQKLVKMAYEAKCTEREGYVDTVYAIFKFNLSDSIDKLAMFMPVDDVLAVLAEEGRNDELWFASLVTACQQMSGFVMEDFCEKLLTLCMPRSENKAMLKVLVETVTGEEVNQSQVDELWVTYVVMARIATGIFR